MLLTALKLVIHIWDLLNILIFPWLSKLFPHRRLCNLFTFFFLLSGAQYRTLSNSNNNNNNKNNNNNNNNVRIMICHFLRLVTKMLLWKKSTKYTVRSEKTLSQIDR